MSRPVILTAKLAGCYSVRSMELTCSLSRQRFLRHGTNGFATCSRECHSATKPLHWLDGRHELPREDGGPGWPVVTDLEQGRFVLNDLAATVFEAKPVERTSAEPMF